MQTIVDGHLEKKGVKSVEMHMYIYITY